MGYCLLSVVYLFIGRPSDIFKKTTYQLQKQLQNKQTGSFQAAIEQVGAPHPVIHSARLV